MRTTDREHTYNSPCTEKTSELSSNLKVSRWWLFIALSAYGFGEMFCDALLCPRQIVLSTPFGQFLGSLLPCVCQLKESGKMSRCIMTACCHALVWPV